MRVAKHGQAHGVDKLWGLGKLRATQAEGPNNSVEMTS
jgi:hypothetical protein